MRSRGYRLTRYADDWLVTCRSYGEARAALKAARGILSTLGVTLNLRKTRIVNVRRGFEFLGYRVKQGPSSVTDGGPANPEWGASRNAICDSTDRIRPALQGPNPQAHTPQGTCEHAGVG